MSTQAAAAPAVAVAPAAKNGATGPGQPLAPPPNAAPAELESYKQKLQAAEAEALKWKRTTVVEKRQWEREKLGFGDKLKAADEWLRVQREAGVSPLTVAKRLWGDKAIEYLNTVAANGGAPTAEAVALEMEKRDERLRGEFAEREAKTKREQEERVTTAERNDGAALLRDAGAAYEYLESEYPLFASLGNKQHIAQVVASQLAGPAWARYRAALASGDIDECAGLMRGAFDKLEKQLMGIAEKALGAEKYKATLAERLTGKPGAGNIPSAVKPSQSMSQGSQAQSKSQPRQTLSNDLTGSTQGKTSGYRSDAQRMADALAKYSATSGR